jgi:signal transduction histidine kinase
VNAIVDRVRSDHRIQDALLAAALFLAFEIEVLTSDYVVGSWVENTIGLLAITLPIAWRRRAPLLSVALIALAVIAQTALLTPVYKPTTTLALVVVPPYSVAANAEVRRAVTGLVAYMSAVVGITLAAGSNVARAVVFNVVMVSAAWLAGRALRNRRQLARELEAKAARIEAEREDRARLAVADERTRIARELHGVVARSVSAMVVQAEAADRLLDEDLDRAEGSLVAIEQTGREALAEMRRLLGVLRTDDDGAELAPQPGIGQAHALVEQARERGLAVELRIEGDPGPVPPGIDLAAYRIMQDTLAEVVAHAHAPGQHAVATVHFGPDELRLSFDLADLGDLEPTENPGLLRTQERVAMYGGKVWAGPGPAGGYRFVARLPRSFEELAA